MVRWVFQPASHSGTPTLTLSPRDFSSCTSLVTFSLELCLYGQWMLEGIVNLTSEQFQLHALDKGSVAGNCILNCSSWMLQHANVTYNMEDCPGRVPNCITDVLGALLCTQRGPPLLRVNGMSITDAVSAAAAIMVPEPVSDAESGPDFDSGLDD